MKEKNNNTRRNFLKKGIALGAFTATGLAITSFYKDEVEETGEKVKLLSPKGEIVEIDKAYVKAPQDLHLPISSEKIREGFPNRKFIMVIDLARCKNALQCVDACNKHHHITGKNAWLKVYKMQESKDTAPYWMPSTCQHCDQPACVTVCPVDATFKRRDGIVLIDNERCIGCRFCMAACPYSARVFNWEEPNQGEITMNLDMNHSMPSPEHAGLPSIKGTVDKCDFCPHQIDKGELPHCVTACPNGVFYFGDKYEDTVTNGDETVRLSKLLEDKAGYRLMEELNTQPSVYYLPPNNRTDDFKDGLENYNEFQSVKKQEES
ncbi:MAG: 4Fe-4S dicluster domain-containing protein [Flavobacteriaceae bacterium]|nr:4Fe-4S dicluster domain-containing protein [Flavobacteriaceae bacterium]